MTKNLYIYEPCRGVSLTVRRSPVHRWGVFATKDIAQYEVLEEAPYFAVPTKQVQLVPECDRYTYWLSDDELLLGMGYAGLYNHSSSPNAEYQVDYVNELIRHYAIKDIKEGEEITIDYGEHNVKSFNLN